MRLKVPGTTLISEHLATNLGVLTTTFRTDSLPEVRELRKVKYTYYLYAYVIHTHYYNVIRAKGYKLKSAKIRDRHTVESGKIPNVKLPCLQGGTQSIANPRSSLELTVQFLLGFHYVVMVDWIIDHVVEFNLQLLSPRRLNWCHLAQSPKPLVTCLVYLEWLTPTLNHLISINYQVWFRGPP